MYGTPKRTLRGDRNDGHHNPCPVTVKSVNGGRPRYEIDEDQVKFLRSKKVAVYTRAACARGTRASCAREGLRRVYNVVAR